MAYIYSIGCDKGESALLWQFTCTRIGKDRHRIIWATTLQNQMRIPPAKRRSSGWRSIQVGMHCSTQHARRPGFYFDVTRTALQGSEVQDENASLPTRPPG